jgi:dipeptidyl aminopeptidase/acylaminoacyl peptidase
VGAQLSPDGKIFTVRDSAAIAHSSSGCSVWQRAEIIRRESDNAGGTFALNLSPDGRFIATTYHDESAKSTLVLLLPVSGGEPRELLRVSDPQTVGANVPWTPDGRAILVNKNLGKSNELLLVLITGGPPRKIDLGVPKFGAVKVHPDGRQIAYVVGDGEKQELWVLEKFLSGLQAGR